MKNIKRISGIVIMAFLSFSCSKSDDAAIVDCFGDSILTELKHSADGTNSKIIKYSIQYSGSNTVTSVKWTFGDGTPAQTVSSATGEVSHTYSAAGTFEVKADVTLSKGGGSCTVSPKKSVTVN
ncbi:PKD domain-containing protein [Flavobacterium chungbukense]|uniref:PKD domain-containing protein n=1 Tax=Flavobacterium chungbukense TaxID=877464 RepID=A0ABP7Y303_9FLAO|nr:PKD domain-containing protein [Flavobacterium chungbukense]MCC4922272.1 PKD domain-containing protein [Flavobacterium chungbukense]